MLTKARTINIDWHNLIRYSTANDVQSCLNRSQQVLPTGRIVGIVGVGGMVKFLGLQQRLYGVALGNLLHSSGSGLDWH